MTSPLLIAISGALAALIANEAVGARKAKRQRRSYDRATLRAIRQELLAIQRMRYLAAQHRARSFRLDTDEVAKTVEKWERKLLEAHQYLLARILQALAVVALTEQDHRKGLASRFRIASYYRPSYTEWGGSR